VDFSELQELIKILEASGLTEIEVEENGRRMRLSKQVLTQTMAAPVQPAPVAPGALPAFPAAANGSGAMQLLENGLITIDSPMVGTFYSSSSSGKPPFVLPGDTVEPNQTVCIVEAMKVMNEVAAKVPAIIEKVLVENGEPVEYGQPLFTVRPLI
jgi:acetyl-CoA carboxylase biotin carboxyl carrier protein